MRSLQLAVFLAAVAPAQHTVIPAEFTDVEAPHVASLAGIAQAKRQQFVIDAGHIAPLVGRTLTGIAFRRNPGAARASGQALLTVRIGAAQVTASGAQPDFARNVAVPVEVFRGAVAIPVSPATAIPDWSPANVVEIAFSTPYLVAAGGLCIDVDGAPVGGATFWPIDAVRDATRGSVQDLGGGCGAFAARFGSTALVRAGELVPGSTARFLNHGPIGAATFALFGVGLLPSPIDLGFAGAPGCTLQVDSFAALAATFSTSEWGAPFGGIAFGLVPVPNQAALLGGRLAVQWVSLAPLTTSNAMLCTIAPAIPSVGVATVEGAGSTATVVDTTSAPVLRLQHR